MNFAIIYIYVIYNLIINKYNQNFMKSAWFFAITNTQECTMFNIEKSSECWHLFFNYKVT